MKRPQGGFTLFEIMVAITITTLLLTTLYGIFAGVSRTKERLESSGEGYHRARIIFDRIGREIRGAYVSAGNPATRFAGGENAEGLPYFTLSTTATTPQGGGRGGLALVAYQLRSGESPEQGKSLVRSEIPLFAAEEGEVKWYRLADGIEELGVRFFDGDDWQNDWDSGLPRSVEVLLTLTVDGASVPFQTSFEVPKIEVP